MSIQISIDEKVKDTFKYNFESDIRDALTAVPENHIIKLYKIFVQYEPLAHNPNAMGSYFGIREGAKEPYIVICAKHLMSCFPQKIPFISKFSYKLYLRHILYHEIAHHYQRLTYGIKKKSWETNAEAYSRYMQRRKYRESFLGKIIFCGKR